MASPLLSRSYQILCGAWRQRYVILMPMLILPLLGALVSVLSAPKYKSHMSFLVQETGKDNPYLSDLSVETNLKGRMSGLTTLLHSRHILTQVVQELHDSEEPLEERELERRISVLSSAIQVHLAGANLISIVMFSDEPGNMKHTLDIVGKHFISALLAPAQSSISNSEQFLRQELTQLEQSLRQSEQEMADYKSTHADELPESHQVNIARLREAQTLLSEKSTELAGAKLVMTNLQSKVLEMDPVLADLESKLVELKSELSQLKTRYTDKHRKVIAVKAQLKRLEQQRGELIESRPVSADAIERFWSLRQGTKTDPMSGELSLSQVTALQQEQQKIKRLSEEVTHLKGDIAELQERVSAFGRNEKILRELERNIEVKSKVYKDLLERFEKAKVSRALGDFEARDRIKLIDKPFNPIRPLNLPMVAFVIFGLVGGMFAGISFAVINELMNSALYYPEQIEQITEQGVIARLPDFQQCPLKELSGGPLTLEAST